jgi:cytochrome c-type biogenesis protein CcmH
MKRLLLILCILATPVLAVQPDEVLSDPVLESRARDISQGLRCPVCQSESIDESNADISRDLRLLVRERLVAGDSDQEAVDFIVARYGEYVLLDPNTKGANLILWIAGPVMLLAALGIGGLYLRRRSPGAAQPALSAEEEARLRDIMRD